MNKKASILDYWTQILMFGVVVMIFVFYSVFMHQVGDVYFLNTSTTALVETGTLLNVSQNSLDIVTQTHTDYKALIMPYDLFFIVLFISAFVTSIIGAFKTRESGVMSFLGMSIFGLMIFLFLLGVVEFYTNWFYTNFIIEFLEFNMASETPVIYNFISNFEFYAFLWALVLLIVSRLDAESIPLLNNNRIGGREE